MFEKRSVSPMYFLGLLFLIFPIYFTAGTAVFPGVLLATLLFGLVLPAGLHCGYELLGQPSVFPLSL